MSDEFRISAISEIDSIFNIFNLYTQKIHQNLHKVTPTAEAVELLDVINSENNPDKIRENEQTQEIERKKQPDKVEPTEPMAIVIPNSANSIILDSGNNNSEKPSDLNFDEIKNYYSKEDKGGGDSGDSQKENNVKHKTKKKNIQC